MKFGSALAALAVATLATSVPVAAAKDEKLPRCSGRQKRPANLYGSVLPTVPDRSAPAAAIFRGGAGVPRGTPVPQAAVAPAPTNLFPPENAAPAPQGSITTQSGTVPAIGPLAPGGGPTAALKTTFASC